MYNKHKTNSPKNGIQVYIAGKRYRSLFSAAVDTDISFCLLQKKLKASGGAPVKIHNKTIVTEDWLLKNYIWALKENPKFLQEA